MEYPETYWVLNSRSTQYHLTQEQMQLFQENYDRIPMLGRIYFLDIYGYDCWIIKQSVVDAYITSPQMKITAWERQKVLDDFSKKWDKENKAFDEA